MDTNQYEDILHFLRNNIYPSYASLNHTSRWNYGRKVSVYFIGTSKVLHKVNYNNNCNYFANGKFINEESLNSIDL